MSHFGYQIAEDCFCEVCGSPAIDIHHVIPRSKFGSKTKHLQDSIGNLIGLCRKHHEDAHSNKITKDELLDIVKRGNYIRVGP